MQTLVYNKTSKNIKLYECEKQRSRLLYVIDSISSIENQDGYYQIIKEIKTNENCVEHIEVLRVPISNTNMFIEM